MRLALERHDAIVRSAIESHRGYVFSIGGDGFGAAFGRVSAPLSTVTQPQAALGSPGRPRGAEVAIRRVATGHDEEGKAVFVSDEMVAPVTLALLPGSEFHLLWGADSTVTFPDDGSRPEAKRYFPPVGGFRFGFFAIPPDSGAGAPADLDIEAALAQLEEKLPGLAEYVEPDNPGMHTTATIDYGVVLSGEADLELDDGAKVTLRVGDSYIQNGTRHRWSNKGDVPAVIAVTLIGANHSKVG